MRLTALVLFIILPSAAWGQEKPIAFPSTPNDATFTRIKAKPELFERQIFMLAGAIKVGNIYTGRFYGESSSYASLEFSRVGSDGTTWFEGNVYVDKKIAGDLLTRTVRAEEQGAKLGVRLRCTVPVYRGGGGQSMSLGAWARGARFSQDHGGDPDQVVKSIEILDWAYLTHDLKSWGPWERETFKKQEAETERAADARSAVERLAQQVERDARQPEFQAAKQAAAEAKKARADAQAKANLKAYKASRPATLLLQAQNLERIKKNGQAIDYYEDLIKEFPGSPQAKIAAERIKILDPYHR